MTGLLAGWVEPRQNSNDEIISYYEEGLCEEMENGMTISEGNADDFDMVVETSMSVPPGL